VVSWGVVNGPFAILAFGGWYEFYRFNAARPPDYESLWYLLCKLGVCPPTALVNLTTPIAVVIGTTLIWRSTVRRHPDIPRWHMAFPLLVMFLISSKVWSPQYGLWLLPWFALSGISTTAYFEYQLAETLLFMVRFMFFATLLGEPGVPYPVLGAVVILRAALLVRCTVSWVRDPIAASTVRTQKGNTPAAA